VDKHFNEVMAKFTDKWHIYDIKDFETNRQKMSRKVKKILAKLKKVETNAKIKLKAGQV
jgi:hypothetical protein